MAALDQRIQLRYHIPAPALTGAEADGYLRAHLALAGRTDTLFSDDAVHAIHAHARGLPRAINRLAINALLAAYTAGKTIADESSARTACWPPFFLSVKSASGVIAGEGHLRRCGTGRATTP